MKTTEEIAHLLELAAKAGREAVRIERDLESDPENRLRICKATIISALRALNERISGEELPPLRRPIESYCDAE